MELFRRFVEEVERVRLAPDFEENRRPIQLDADQVEARFAVAEFDETSVCFRRLNVLFFRVFEFAFVVEENGVIQARRRERFERFDRLAVRVEPIFEPFERRRVIVRSAVDFAFLLTADGAGQERLNQLRFEFVGVFRRFVERGDQLFDSGVGLRDEFVVFAELVGA